MNWGLPLSNIRFINFFSIHTVGFDYTCIGSFCRIHTLMVFGCVASMRLMHNGTVLRGPLTQVCVHWPLEEKYHFEFLAVLSISLFLLYVAFELDCIPIMSTHLLWFHPISSNEDYFHSIVFCIALYCILFYFFHFMFIVPFNCVWNRMILPDFVVIRDF